MSRTLNPDQDQDAPVCSQCGQAVRLDEAIRLGDRWVCANCKPACVQKLREGENLDPEPLLSYAGFWIRGAAVIIDAVLQYTLGVILGMLCGQNLAEASGFDGNEQLTALDRTLLCIGILIDLTYSTLMVGRYGATLGKLAMGLRVLRADGGRVSYARALGRCLMTYVSILTCMIGYLMAAFDREKRALHDRVCDTRVIRAPGRSSVAR